LSSSLPSKKAYVPALTPAISMAQHPDLWAWGTKHRAMLVKRSGNTEFQGVEALLAPNKQDRRKSADKQDFQLQEQNYFTRFLMSLEVSVWGRTVDKSVIMCKCIHKSKKKKGCA
jgi:hypothetical protein